MNINEIMFIVGIFGFLGVTLYKLYCVMAFGKSYKEKERDYDMKIPFILFISLFILWLISFLAFSNNLENYVYIMLFRLISWLIPLNVLFFIIELFYSWKTSSVKTIEPYMSRRS